MGLPSATTEKTAKMSPMTVKNMSFKEGQELKISCKLKDDCSGFSINIGHDPENVALHFNPRLDGCTVVCNSMSGGSWADEHREDDCPFQCGEEHKVIINFTMDDFYIKLPNEHMMHFPNRLGDVKYKYIEVRGDAKVISLKIK